MRIAVIAIFSVLVTSFASAADEASARRSTHIPAQELAPALRSLAQALNFQIVYASHDVSALRTRGAIGEFTPEEALKQVLEGTGLTYRYLDDKTITVAPPESQSTASSGNETDELAKTNNATLSSLQLARVEAPDDKSALAREQRQKDAAARAESTHADQEILVTGTHISGVDPVGSKLLTITREEFIASGYSRYQDYLETLPQNFSGSASEDSSATFNQTSPINFSRGQAIDIRGLGASSTLVLVNGRRQPAGGLVGAFVDISSIAPAAIERVEILTDGASAIYGSDAIGGVVNFIFRKDYEGIESNIRAATMDGTSEDYQASLVMGRNWTGGNVLFGYQYSLHDAVMCEDLTYCSRGKDYRSFGGTDMRTVGGSPGTISRASQPSYALPAGQNGRNLTLSQLTVGQNFADEVTGLAYLPRQEQHSGFFAVRHDVSESTEIFAEGRLSHRKMELPATNPTATVSVPATNPFYFNPYGGTANVSVAHSFAEDMGGPTLQVSDTNTYSVAIGAVRRLRADWKLDLSGDYGYESNKWENRNNINTTRRNACLTGLTSSGCPGIPLNVYGDGAVNDPVTIDYIRSVTRQDGVSKIASAGALANGSLFALPGGNSKLAVGADYRDERLDAGTTVLAPASGIVTPGASPIGKLSREVVSAFAEWVAPVYGRDPSAGLSMNLSLAARHEHYSDFGDTTDPKIGVDLNFPVGVKVRATWGTSFRAPRFSELSSSGNPPASQSVTIADPKSLTNSSVALLVFDPVKDLRPETADIWTAGVDWTPAWLPDFTASLTYFDIDYTDKIQNGGQFTDTLLFEDQWSEIITRAPAAAQITAICNSPGFSGACPASAASIIQLGLRNIGSVEVSGVDLDARYRTAFAGGMVSAGLSATHLQKYDRAASASAAAVDVVDTVGFPLSWRLRGTLTWSRGGWSINSAVNYADSYEQNAIPAPIHVASLATVDAGIAYGFDEGAAVLQGARIQIGVTNLFDRDPPFINVFNGFDPANANQTGRTFSAAINKRW